jgi:UDP-2,3-diacylglucosamine hydrolase
MYALPFMSEAQLDPVRAIPPGQIFVIGDLHIGLAEGDDRIICEWLDRLALHSPHALYMNGDVFHYLIAHRNFRTSSIDGVMEKLRQLRDSGIRIHYVEGNRDFFLKGSFVEQSVTDAETEYAVGAGTNRYLIVHGDMINDRDWPYRFWRRLSKNPVMRLSVGLIPKKIAKSFVDGVEAKLAKSNFKHKTRVPVELIAQYAARRGTGGGFTHAVLGHFHKKLMLPGPVTAAVLPAWYESGEAMMIDPLTGSFEWVVI